MSRQRGTVGAGVLLGLLVLAVAGRGDEVAAVKAIEKLGADVMVLMNVSSADPHAALRVYGEKVLPELRAGT